MIRTFVLLAIAATATPALAQQEQPADQATDASEHAGHESTDEDPDTPPASDPHAGHMQPDEQAAEPDPHAGHAQPEEQTTEPDPHAGHGQPEEQAAEPDPHAGHGSAAAQGETDPHAGHSMGTAASPPVAPPPPEASSGPAHAADLVYGPAEMAQMREVIADEHGSMKAHKFLVDRMETKLRDGSDGYAWSGQFWYGGDIDKFWLETEGEGDFDGSADVEVQAVWSHALDPWFDLRAGLRQDLANGPDRTHLVLGVQGLAPYWFEVEGALFLSNKGDLTARLEGEYDLRLTQRLILQPRIEVDLAAQDVPELGIGAGLSTAEAGVRLRYELRPEIAPYVGIEYERAFGDTRDFRHADGEEASGWSFLVGLRAWF